MISWQDILPSTSQRSILYQLYLSNLHVRPSCFQLPPTIPLRNTGHVGLAVRGVIKPRTASAIQITRNSHSEETDEEFDARYENYFNRPDIDNWEIRKAMNDLAGMDLVPEPKIVCAALRACRRLNDYALAIRFLEVVRYKGGDQSKVIWPYIVQEIKPTLEELGIETPEQLGYDKPELALQSVYDMH